MPDEFDLITVDSPWPETGGGGRGTAKHYDTVAWDEIPALVLGSPVWRPARAYWLGVWATKTAFTNGAASLLMQAAGVRPVTVWTWIKLSKQGSLKLGTGQYGRHGVEFLIWGKRGTIGRDGDAWQKAEADFARPLGRHSEKPAFAYEQAARVFDAPRRLAMFERAERPGFTVWGDEAPKEAA